MLLLCRVIEHIGEVSSEPFNACRYIRNGQHKPSPPGNACIKAWILEKGHHDIRLCWTCAKVQSVEPTAELAQRFSESILHHLLNLNADFREAWHEYPETLIPEIQLYGLGQGPFKEDSGRIKQARML